MAFFRRLMDHLLNQVLVDTLAHSKWFQKFVVHTTKLSQEVSSKGGAAACGLTWGLYASGSPRQQVPVGGC
jgi:hypothetical protein